MYTTHLIIESAEIINQPQRIEIISRDARKVKFSAILQSVDVENRNKRCYVGSDMKQAIDFIRPRLQTKTFGGELDHPIVGNESEKDWIRHTTFLWKESSHLITEIWFENNLIMGNIETTSTPNGYALAGLLNDGVQMAFSLRAISDNLEQKGGVTYVRSPITIVSYDAVSFPSHKEAYITEIKTTESEIVRMKQTCKDGQCFLYEHQQHFRSNKSINLTENTSLFPGKKFRF
jgi:hypothetical protein